MSFSKKLGKGVSSTGPIIGDAAKKHRQRIDTKHSQLGGSQGVLGQVLGSGVKNEGLYFYRPFQFGWIYSYDQITAAVYGAIGEKWRQTGGGSGPLGYPIADEKPAAGNGRVSHFQHGAIYWSPTTGTVEVRNYVVRFKGLKCFGEQSWVNEKGGADEPYLIVSIYTDEGKVATHKFPPDHAAYQKVNSGTAIPWTADCYHGAGGVVNMRCLLMEHDEGDPNAYRDAVDKAVKTAIKAGTMAITGGTPVDPPDDSTEMLVGAINDLLGTGDDVITEGYKSFSSIEAGQLADRPLQMEDGISYHFDVYLTDGDATYKAYFDVVRVNQ